MTYSFVNSETDYWKERQEYIPGNYKDLKPKFTAESITTDQIISTEIGKKAITVPLLHVKTEKIKYRTKKPIQVRIYEDDDLFFAENENLNVCGYGESKEKAIIDLGLHILYFFDYYAQKDNTELIDNGIRLKELYKELLIKE